VTIKSHRDLIVWQKAMVLAAEVYRLTKVFPADERFRMTDQLLRAASSIPANIAEGHARGTRKDYAHFVVIARGSLAEAETFLALACDVGLVNVDQCRRANELAVEVGRMLNALVTKLRLPASLKPET
jgi:four helix bundle protein